MTISTADDAPPIDTASKSVSERVLIVEDEQAARVGLEQLVKSWGFTADSAVDGEDALEKVTTFRPAIVISDLVMPRMDGVELAEQILQRWPEMAILFTSGHAAEVLAQHGLESLDVPFLAKPYTRDEALAKVREALERRQDSPRD